MTEAPHVPAAFINAIAEEGTKSEAISELQKIWNENCELRQRLATAQAAYLQFIEASDAKLEKAREALEKALRQWKFYADNHDIEPSSTIETDNSAEGDVYRWCLTALKDLTK